LSTRNRVLSLIKQYICFVNRSYLFLVSSLIMVLLLVTPTPVFASVPTQVTLRSPANNSINVSTAPVLSWNAVAGAIEYQVEVYRINITGGARVDVLRQQTSGTSLLVRRPFLTPPGGSTLLEGRDLLNREDLLRISDNYRWRVRARNATGWGTWSSSWVFVTNPRNVWSPFRTEVTVTTPAAEATDTKHLWVRWNQEAIDWYAREQSWWIWQIRKELWWEHELRGGGVAGNFWSSVVNSSLFSHLPEPWLLEFDTADHEVSIGTERPELLRTSHQVGGTVRPDYWSTVRFYRVSNRPAAVDVVVESEITDWPAMRPWWDEVGSLRVPTGNVRVVLIQ